MSEKLTLERLDMSKLISSKMFERMYTAVEDMYGETRGQEQARDMVLELLAIQGVEVEPEPCLPGISQELFYQKHSDRQYIYDSNRKDPDSTSAYMSIGNVSQNAGQSQLAYARLFTAAPKLAQAVADLLREFHKTNIPSEEIKKRLRRAIIHAGVSVEWLTGEEETI